MKRFDQQIASLDSYVMLYNMPQKYCTPEKATMIVHVFIAWHIMRNLSSAKMGEIAAMDIIYTNTFFRHYHSTSIGYYVLNWVGSY